MDGYGYGGRESNPVARNMGLDEMDFAERCWRELGAKGVELLIAYAWTVWKAKCEASHDGKTINWDGKAEATKRWVSDYMLIHNRRISEPTNRCLPLRQRQGVRGYTLQVDANYTAGSPFSATRGIIYDEENKTLLAFGNLHIKPTTVKCAELVAIRDGLKMGRGLNVQDMWCFSDSLLAVQAVAPME